MDNQKSVHRGTPENDLGEYLRDIQARHRRAVVAIKARGATLKWRARLRVRMGIRLGTDELVFKTKFQGRVLTICSRISGQALKDAEWVIISASRFSTVEKAIRFGRNLQTALSAMAAIKRYSLDVGGDNLASAQWSDEVKDVAANAGGFLFDDVHGLDIVPDTPASFSMMFGATLTVSTQPQVIFDAVEAISKSALNAGDVGVRAALLLNAASMADHPAGKLVLAVGAIEMLAGVEKWSGTQKQWIRNARSEASQNVNMSEDERSELDRALQRMFRFSIREGTRRLLVEIGRADIVEDWDRLYARRSDFVHANSHFTYPELVEISASAQHLCPIIFEAYLIKRANC